MRQKWMISILCRANSIIVSLKLLLLVIFQASLAGVQILAGEMDEAICSHAFYWALWQKYEMLPERFNWKLKAPDVYFYPLRPEFIGSYLALI